MKGAGCRVWVSKNGGVGQGSIWSGVRGLGTGRGLVGRGWMGEYGAGWGRGLGGWGAA